MMMRTLTPTSLRYAVIALILIFASSALAHPLDELQDEAYQPNAPKMLDIATALERDGRLELGFFVQVDALLEGAFTPPDMPPLTDGPKGKELTPQHLAFIEDHVRALVEVYADEVHQTGILELRKLAETAHLPATGKVWAQFSFEPIESSKTITLVVNARIDTVKVGIINAADSAKSRLVRLVKDDPHAVLIRGEIVPVALESRSQALRTLLYPEEDQWRIIQRYLHLGFIHILPKGLDHILFVLALFLLAIRFKPLLIQISLFTVAHTLTLGLSIMEVIKLPGNVVEPLIALSICYVAIENCRREELKASRMSVVFGFGLLHGMGFAGVLSELGLPKDSLFSALIAFNVGVELGQLAVILCAVSLVGWFRDAPWFRGRIVLPTSIAIAAVGLFWTVERVFA